MTLRVLVVESDPEQLMFLRDVLAELDGSPSWGQWTHVDAHFAATWESAAVDLENANWDAVLLDLDLEDCRGKETFRRYLRLAPRVPVVLLIREEPDAMLAQHLLREGAQDFLLWSHVDCAPLARSLRNAIDRHRLLSSSLASSMIDSLTGLLSRDAFLLLADRDRRLAESLGRRQLIVLATPTLIADDDEQGDLYLLNAADHLRNLAGATDLIGRVADDHLAISILDSTTESAEQAWSRMESAAHHRVRLGAALFDPAHPESLDRLLEIAALSLEPVHACV
jgi:DNA-binding NarL/FixJ family response regulator